MINFKNIHLWDAIEKRFNHDCRMEKACHHSKPDHPSADDVDVHLPVEKRADSIKNET